AFSVASWNISTFRIGDVGTYPFDKTKPLVVAFHCSNTSDLVQMAATGWASYLKAAVDEASTTNVTGYSPATAGTTIGVFRVEIFTPETNWYPLHNVTLNT